MDAQTKDQRIVDTLSQDTLKLLLPVDATERSRWGINYALERAQSGRDVAVSLLFVAEPVTDWQILRFLRQEEVRRLQAERGNHLLEDAAQALERAGIPVQTHYREGDIVFQTLDIAEQLSCNEIVLPVPYPGWGKLFALDRVREIHRCQRSIPVTTVNASGMPDNNWES